MMHNRVVHHLVQFLVFETFPGANAPPKQIYVYIEFWLLFSKSLSTDKNTKSLLFRTQNQQGFPNVILCCDTIIFIPIRNIFGHFTLDFALILPFKIEINIPASNMPRIKKNTNFHDFKN